MPVFQLELATILVGCAIISTTLLYHFDFNRSRDEGNIQLKEDREDETLAGGDVEGPYRDDPETEVGEDEGVSARRRGKQRGDDGFGEEEKDPFDVTTPMDMVDGRPVDEGRFWAKVRPFN